ncbi:MAG: protein translocase subunit SecF, partial [Alphaproteobacteria bacterium]|nr:protein translocase subunit SecF [Alphaproteobacteria bacterium]
MRLLSVVPANTTIDFVGKRKLAFGFSIILILVSVGAFLTQGLNFGIDFRGGILMEIETEGPADIGALRRTLGALGLGEVKVQEFGEPTDVLIRVQQQEGDEDAQLKAITVIKEALGDVVTEYRRTEFV